MPIYEYRCRACGCLGEVVTQRILGSGATIACHRCGGPGDRRVSVPAIRIFKPMRVQAVRGAPEVSSQRELDDLARKHDLLPAPDGSIESVGENPQPDLSIIDREVEKVMKGVDVGSSRNREVFAGDRRDREGRQRLMRDALPKKAVAVDEHFAWGGR